MKKLFLIPLMALFACVSVWADPVTTLEALQDALNAGGEVTLGATIDAGTTGVTFTSGTATLNLGDFTITSSKAESYPLAPGYSVTGGGTLKVSGGSLTITAGTLGAIEGTGVANAIYVNGGSLIIEDGTFTGENEGIFVTNGSLTINGGTLYGGDNAVWAGGSNASLTINGGAFSGGWGAVQSDNGASTVITDGTFAGTDVDLALGAYLYADASCTISGGEFNGKGIIVYTAGGTLFVNGGAFKVNPIAFVDFTSYIVTKPSSMYIVSAPTADVVAYNPNKLATYASLSAAVEAASAADVIYLYKNDASAVTVAKNITIATNGHTTNLSAGAGYSRADMGQNVVFTDNAIAAFLMADGTNSMTIDANANIATAGQIIVNGTKTLTIADGVTIYYERQASGANILVPDGATLTILGNGTFNTEALTEAHKTAATSTQLGNRAIDVSGTLIVGAEGDDTNIPHFITTSPGRGSAIMVNPTGKAYLYNADIQAALLTIWNEGRLEIFDGNYVSTSSLYYENNGYVNAKAENWRAYGTQGKAGSYTMIHGGHFKGIQGGVCFVDGALADIEGGTFETVHYSEEHPYNHYALFVATGAIVNVRGGKFSIETPGNSGHTQVILIGDNDAGTTFGIINLYGGIFQQKPYLSQRKAQDAEVIYPVSIPLTSQWYSSFGTNVPLPAGYEYYDITEGEDYEAGYRYEVRPIAGKETDGISEAAAEAQKEAEDAGNEYTIPWQQATTWATDEVPETNTIVTIPVDATVTVSKDEETKTAVADQVYVSQGATLKVEEGTTLTVGNGGMNIGNGGQIVVEAGATVKIGSAGVITTEEDALVIESNDDVQGVLLYEPTVAENTQPKATVKLSTKAKQIGDNSYVFERFAIPTIDGAATTYSIEGGLPTTGLYNGAPSFLQAVWEWNNDEDEWQQLSLFQNMQPFHGYQLTNNTANGGLVYVFEGNLVGNQNESYEFVENGFHFFGNSYSADINIKLFLNSLGAEVEKTVWVYDPYDKTFKTVTERTANGRVTYGNGEQIKDVRSMQAFLMYLADGESGTAGVNYASAIWGNPKYGNSASPAPAKREASNEDWVTIRVSAANGLKDEVMLNQSEDLTAAFENGADANKFMNKENINLFAATNAGNLAVVATNELNNTVLTFAAGNATEYTLNFVDIEGYEFTLRDNVTGATVLMTEGASYTFEQEANTTVPARFEVLGAPKTTTAIDNIEEAAKATGIYTITGQYLGRDFTKLPAGVYVVNGVKIVK